MSGSSTGDSEDAQLTSREHPPRDPFHIQDAVSDGEHTLVLRGELDLGSAPELDDAVAKVCAGEASSMVVDLSSLQFMDSTGIHSILSAQALCAAAGCEFRLIPGPTNVQRLFEITGLTGSLPFVDQPVAEESRSDG